MQDGGDKIEGLCVALLDTTVYVDLRGRGGKARKLEAEEIVQQLLRDGEYWGSLILRSMP